jgi:hypothetical protein
MSRTGRWYAFAAIGCLAALLSGHVWVAIIVCAITTPPLLFLSAPGSHDDSSYRENAANLAALRVTPLTTSDELEASTSDLPHYESRKRASR